MGKHTELLPGAFRRAKSSAVASVVGQELKQGRFVEPTRWEIGLHEINGDQTPLPEAAGTLVIGDVHNRIARADAWIEDQRFDRIVVLGDYFDHVGDTTDDAERTARWVKKRVHDPRVTLVIGNHDLAYRWPGNDSLICPGYSSQKAAVIHSILEPNDWQRMRLACFVEGWLVSHAGFHPTWIAEPSIEAILDRCALAEQRAARGEVDPIFAYGEIPGGVQRYGGPLWMDWHSFLPIPGVNQIVGHTPADTVRVCSIPGSDNVCIDVDLSVGAVISNGQVSLTRCPM